MTPAEVARMNELCQQIILEKDQKKFISLIVELSDLLERKNQRLEKADANRPQN